MSCLWLYTSRTFYIKPFRIFCFAKLVDYDILYYSKEVWSCAVIAVISLLSIDKP